jgi:glycosyltransferase involved in cell wall biosynthesis
MKIAFIFPPIWPVHVDGSLQIWNREVTTRLSKTCDVIVYSGSFPVDSHDRADRAAYSGVAYHQLSTHWDSRLLKYLQLFHHAVQIKKLLFASDFWYPWYALRVALDIRKRGCDVVHVYNYPQFCSIIKYFNPNVRVVLNMHGELLTQVSFKNIYCRLRHVDAVISCSEFVSRAIRAKFPAIANRCRTVPMGISTDAFSTNRHFVSDNTSPRRLLYVGRVSPEKGVHVLLDAFEIILRQYPDASLMIVGPEWILPREYLADLCLDRDVVEGFAHFYGRSYIEKLKDNLSPEAKKRVTFTGLIPHRDVPNYYANTDIYISPSFYESFGMSVIEAMAEGLPVVAVAGGALPDLISDGSNGLLVAPGNPAAIARAVENLITSDRLRKSIVCDARKIVCKKYSYESICSLLMEIYHGVLSSPFVSGEAVSPVQIV